MPAPGPPSISRRIYLWLFQWSIVLRVWLRKFSAIMAMPIFKKLWGWEVIGIAAPFLYGLGVAAMYGDEYSLASTLYFIGIALLTAKTLTWEETHILERRKKYSLAFLILLVAALCFFLSMQWVESRRQRVLQQMQQQQGPSVSQMPSKKDIQDIIQEVFSRFRKSEPSKVETKSEPTKPTPERAKPQPRLTLIFKDSPLFTSTRKERIRNEMESFYQYLVMVGFDPPKEVPPLGTGEIAASAGIIPGPVYWSHITINAKHIDDPLAIVGAYAMFAFGNMLHAGDPNWRDSGQRTIASWILSEYFSASFLGRTPKSVSTGTLRWVNAIWVIRQKFGREFTDKAMLFTLKSFNDRATEDIRMSKDTMSEDEFNKSFATHFLFGEYVADNNMARYEQITRILKDNGLLK